MEIIDEKSDIFCIIELRETGQCDRIIVPTGSMNICDLEGIIIQLKIWKIFLDCLGAYKGLVSTSVY